MSTCWSSIKWSVAFLSGCPLVLSGTRSWGFLVTLSHDKAWLCFFSSDPALLCPGPQSLWGWACVTWPTISAHAQRGWLGRETYRWRMRSDTQSGFLCVGRNVWIPRVSQVRTQTASCAQVSASSRAHPTQLGPRDQQLRGSPKASFQLVPGGRAWGCVSCPPVLPVFQRQGTWLRFTSLSICCVWNRTGTGGREAPHGLYELTGLTVWLLYFCDWRHPAQAFLAGLWSRVQVTWSRKMPVWHPHRQWWTWWTWRGDTVCLCRSLGVTHIRPFKLLFTHISHKWVGRSSVMGICFASHSGPLQHRCTHTCMHMHTGMHTPPTYNTQSRFRGWELLVSQCANCFSLLSPWISQQESDVSIEAQGGLSKAPLLELGISILPTLSALQIFSLSLIHSGLPRGWTRAHFSAVIYGIPPYAPP